MSYKRKQIVGFGIILSLMVMIMIVIMVMINIASSGVSEIVNNRYKNVKATTDFRDSFNSLDRELVYLAIEQDNSKTQGKLQTIENYRQQALAQLLIIDGLTQNEQGRQLLATIRVQYDTYLNVVKQITDIQKNALSENSATLLINEAQPSRTELILVIQKLRQLQETLMDDAQKRLNNLTFIVITLMSISELALIVIGTWIAVWVVRGTTKSLNEVTDVLKSTDFNSAENLPRLNVQANDEIGNIATSFNAMANTLEIYNKKARELNEIIEETNWIQNGVAETATMYQGINDTTQLANSFISKICMLLGANYGVFYLQMWQDDQQKFVKIASYAVYGNDEAIEEFRLGEGLIGQSAMEGRTIILHNLPDHYLKVASGLGQAFPKSLIITPIEFKGQVEAVIEVACLETFTPLQQQLLEQIRGTFGIALNNVRSRMELDRLLKESQLLTEELQAQSEEFQVQQEELQTINEKLVEQNQVTEQKTKELQATQKELEIFSEELQKNSKYKLEFLANMSHELRTPLNSMLILSEILEENSDGSLTSEEKEYARVIHNSGHDLLILIDDILDLSKAEAGKLDLVIDWVNISELPELMNYDFEKLAKKKGLSFTTIICPDVPNIVHTDGKRLNQTIKNLLSNAMKFTEQGSVIFKIQKADQSEIDDLFSGETSDFILKISVSDTGIGISKENQKHIFEAFQQADGTTERIYGGTGLGLSISREFAKLLKGCIVVESEEGKGSTFTLYIPDLDKYPRHERVNSYDEVAATAISQKRVLESTDSMSLPAPSFKPGDPNLFKGKKVLLVDDDIRNIFSLTAALTKQGLVVQVANNGQESLETLRNNPPFDLILMDIMMPVMDGYEAMKAIRIEKKWANIPIIALTAKAMKEDRELCLASGASDYISKPLNIQRLFSLMRVWMADEILEK
jgi:two-component system chemotaxis sensor kinase CheA